MNRPSPSLLSLSRLLSTLTLTLIALPVATLSVHADDATDIQGVYTHFKTTILAHDTQKAAEAFAPSTFAYFDKIKSLAAKSSPVEISKLPVLDHLAVEILIKYAGTNLSQLTLPQIAADGIQKEWIQLEGLNNISLGAVTVNGSNAFAQVIVKDKPTKWSIPFVKTETGWKLDPLSYYKMGELILRAEVMRHKFDESGTINNIVDSMQKKKN
jgi:hypothetical protein